VQAIERVHQRSLAPLNRRCHGTDEHLVTNPHRRVSSEHQIGQGSEALGLVGAETDADIVVELSDQ
jgi:hypothetical protein